MELADYPDIIIREKKRELTAERESLLRRKARIDTALEALPQIDPKEIEIALGELAKPFQMANDGGYCMPHPMSWERNSVASGNWRADMPRRLTLDQAHLLRETLLKLNCRITAKNRTLFISGALPLGRVRVKQTAS